MKTQLMKFALLATALALIIVTGAEAQKGKNKDKAALVAGVPVATKTTGTTNTGQCKAPRPPNRGCKVACKPCQIPVCEDGKWVYEKVEIDKDQCRPHSDDNGGACTIGLADYCPPSCKTCIRQ